MILAMARRAFLPTIPPPAGPPPVPSTRSQPPPPSVRQSVPPPSVRPSVPPPSQRPSAPPPSMSGGERAGDRVAGERGERLSSPPGVDSVAMHAVTQLLDRLAAADESQFLVGWTEQMLTGRSRLDPALAVRLLRAY